MKKYFLLFPALLISQVMQSTEKLSDLKSKYYLVTLPDDTVELVPRDEFHKNLSTKKFNAKIMNSNQGEKALETFQNQIASRNKQDNPEEHMQTLFSLSMAYPNNQNVKKFIDQEVIEVEQSHINELSKPALQNPTHDLFELPDRQAGNKPKYIFQLPDGTIDVMSAERFNSIRGNLQIIDCNKEQTEDLHHEIIALPIEKKEKLLKKLED